MKNIVHRTISDTNNRNRNDPGRFFGDGVTFKAKLIGILEVGEARGDKMCQEALQDLKMAIRAAGEHKQRITIHVTIDGLRLRDEKTGDSLYHHPVHKISFIAQDMTDSRAFGYIFGSPDSGHRFFGIKTDKAASQVVLAMRDLFQVVFELKKKEIELARQQIQSKTIHEHQSSTLPTLLIKSTSSDTSNHANKIDGAKAYNTKEPNLMSPESVADLVDLEQELSSIQRGITQLDRITPSEPTAGVLSSIESGLEDPFGDSFTNFGSGTGSKAYNLLPPPESSRSRHSKPIKPPEATVTTTSTSSVTASSSPTPRTYPYSYNTNPKSNITNITQESESWLNEMENTDVFHESGISTKSGESISSLTGIGGQTVNNIIPTTISNDENISSIQQQQQQSGENVLNNHKSQQLCTESGCFSSVIDTKSQYTDAFTELDPLGTGKSKPYVDKKYFFHELKNPPKKVLKDLSGSGLSSLLNDSTTGFTTFTTRNDSSNDMDDIFDTSESYEPPPPSSSGGANYRNGESSMEDHSNIEASTVEPTTGMLVRDTDPFSPTRKKSDPFQDGDIFNKLDPFEIQFGKSMILCDTIENIGENDKLRKECSSGSPSVFNGPLQVSLPPENSWSASTAVAGNTYPDATYSSSQRGRIDRQCSESPTSGSRNRPSVFKQNTVDVISSISSKKMPHLFGQKFTKRDSHSINMRRLQESDSLSENETAPEPPPRPDTWSQHEPPPLPPKKQFSDIVIRPRITSSSAIQPPPPTRYDYVTAKLKSSQLSLDGSTAAAPPIPLPSRRVGRTDSNYPGPGRPRKPGCDEEDYLAPLANRGDVPPLLPPPQTKSRSSRRQESMENKPISNAMSISSDKQSGNEIVGKKIDPESILPDITLSQLLTLGIDDLANKLNVPITKLNTMTIVELTTYLSEFLERSNAPKSSVVKRPSSASVDENAHIFKVNFDQNSDVTFVAKFDDNFGEESLISNAPFVANFSQFDVKPEPTISAKVSSNVKTIVPSADRYAVFREIMDQDNLKSDSVETKSSPENEEDFEDYDNNDNSSPLQQKLAEFSDEEDKTIDNSLPPISKIDNKITEAISHAKDRYAALRDIILVEDLFDNQKTETKFSDLNFGDEMQIDEKLVEEFPIGTDIENIESVNENIKNQQCRPDYDSSPDSNHNFEDLLELESNEVSQKDLETKKNNGTLFMHTLTVSATTNKDDLEIDELMNRAISNLSLDSRDHLSPNNQNKSPIVRDNNQQEVSPVSPSILQQQFRKSPLTNPMNKKSQFNDVSTSPIPISLQPSKSPALVPQPLTSSSIIIKSPIINKSPIQSRSPIPQSSAVTNLIIGFAVNKLNNSGSLSDMVCGSSPDIDKQSVAPVSSESWAIFDKPPTDKKEPTAAVVQPQQHSQRAKSSKGLPPHASTTNNKEIIGESPCSSDGKDDWKNAGGGGGSRRWPKGQTSSSSRDLSPWDDDATNDYKKRIPAGPGTDRHGYYMRHSKRINSCDDDYEYDDEMAKRRDRKSKGGISRSRDNFEFDSQNWYQPGTHHSWSPQDEDERIRAFDRGTYERSSYGPPAYDKREQHKLPQHSGYDRRANDYKTGYDKRKYYREYCRPTDYDFESYGESPDIKDRKIMYSRRDYENIYDDGGGFGRSDGSRTGSGIYKAREYFYGSGGGGGDRRSFDRESVESYESTGRRRKSFGSGEVYGSFDSREEFRERYLGGGGVGGGEKTRSLRMGFKVRGSAGGDDYEQDSENDAQIRRVTGEHTRSLQRPGSGPRIRKSSGSSPWDGEEPPQPTTGGSHGSKNWKRPSSASESSERRMAAENRRVLSHTLSGGSDGEKDRRFRKKQRGRGKDGSDSRLPVSNLPPTSGRYSSTHRDNYDYVYDDYAQEGSTSPKIDEDKFERLNRRRQDMNQRLVDADRRKRVVNNKSGEKYIYDDEEDDTIPKYTAAPLSNIVSQKETYIKNDKDRYAARCKFETYDDPKIHPSQQKMTGVSKTVRNNEYDFDDYEETPRSNASSHGGKFNFEEHGFESDFNTSPSATTPSQKQQSFSGKSITPKSSFRFSNDFSSSDKQHHNHHLNQTKHSISSANYDPDFSPTISSIATPAATSVHSITPTTTTTTPLQKLRFDDKVTISKFDNNEPSSSAFDDDDDDFSKAQFDFENEDQWHPDEPPKKNNMRLGGSNTNKQYHQQRQQSTGNGQQQQQHDHLRKSESVNIFAKKADDPFEDDDFFNSSTNDGKKNNNNNNNNGGKVLDSFHWDNNFAKFDENM